MNKTAKKEDCKNNAFKGTFSTLKLIHHSSNRNMFKNEMQDIYLSLLTSTLEGGERCIGFCRQVSVVCGVFARRRLTGGCGFL